MKSQLVERSGTLKLVESKNLRKGCLGRLEGPCADFKNPTRNGRKYGLQLWKNVFNNDIVKESLATHTLFGELDHPEDRFECLSKFACVCMTDYKIDEDAGIVYGGFDILDTTQGRTLKALLDYGSQMGVSSRGEGDLIQGEDGEEVDPDTYDFSCFDVVSTPAVKKARQTVVESVEQNKKKYNLLESLQKEIDGTTNVETLDAIERTVTNADIPNLSKIRRLINNKKSQIVEGKTISSNTSNKNISKVNRTTKTIREDINTDAISIAELNRKIRAYKLREKRLAKTISEQSLQIKNLTKTNSDLTTANNRLYESNNQRKQVVRNERLLTSKVQKQSSKILELENSNNYLSRQKDRSVQQCEQYKKSMEDLKRDNDRLLENVNSLQDRLTESNKIIESYKVRQQQLKDSLTETQSKLNNQKTICNEQRQVASDRNNDIMELEQSYDKLEQDYNVLLEKYQQLESNHKDLLDLNASLSDKCKDVSAKLSESTKLNKQFTNSFIEELSAVRGIDPKSVSLNESISTPARIKQVIKDTQERQDRYKKLPISYESPTAVNILKENINNYMDDEDKRLTDFLMSAQSSL